MKRVLKILKENGLLYTLKFIKFHFKLKKQTEYINKSGFYKLKKDNNNIIPKKGETNITIEMLKEKINKTFLSELNIYGYSINLHTNDNNFEEILPVSKIKISSKITQQKSNLNNLLNKRLYQDSQIDLSIIVLNYNNKNCVFKCIDSLLLNNNYNYQIIVVDNNSSDGSYEKLVSNYSKKITILRNKENGCSSGRNLAISHVKNEYIMFLDSDQFIINKYWLDNYIYIIKNMKNCGAVGWACGWFDQSGYPEFTNFDFELMKMPPWGLCRRDIGYLGTGGMLLKKEIFQKTLGFDCYYDPTGYEDTDFSLQIKSLGYDLYYSPYLGIIHEAHQSTSKNNYNELLKRNGKYFRKKWKDSFNIRR